jgi:D-alanine transaminase
MARIVYTNGRYVPYAQASVHVEDRGYQLGHAVYEVIEVFAGALVDATRHLDRLDRSAREVMIPAPMSRAALLHVVGETLRRNGVTDGSVYIQVSRGAAPRDFAMPGPEVRPSLVVIARAGDLSAIEARAEDGIAVVTQPDIRWGRCDIKTVMLLPACLAKEAARGKGAREAWLVDRDGFVTEGASSNAWIVTEAGEVVTRQLGCDLLPGVTRATLIDVCALKGLQVKERPFRVSEALSAREAFITSASQTVMPVTSIDGHAIGGGKPGPLARQLRQAFRDTAEKVVLSTSHIRPRA